MFIDVGQVSPVAVVIADAEWERIASNPLHLSAINANRDVGIWNGFDKLPCQISCRIGITDVTPGIDRERKPKQLAFAGIE
ncbi:MAG: hypothetical protein KGR48_13450 [Alphaproteobacteria bacterium]|nr:hypothetical protein [Alphaproteobacteria bacterium]